MMDGKRILVTGGTGFIGRHLVNSLLLDKQKVLVLSRKDLGLKNEELHTAKGDLNSILSLQNIFSANQIDCVIHLGCSSTPSSSVKDACRDLTDNVLPALNLLNLCIEYRVKNFIFASSGGTVYGNNPGKASEESSVCPISPYGVHKLAVEKYIQVYAHLYGLKYIILRIANPYGKGQIKTKRQGLIASLLASVLNNSPTVIWGQKDTVKDYIYIQDLISGIMHCFRHGRKNEIYNLGTGTGTSIAEMVSLVKEVTGRTPELEYHPPAAWDVRHNVLDSSKLAEHTGWKAGTSIREGLEKFWQELKYSYTDRVSGISGQPDTELKRWKKTIG